MKHQVFSRGFTLIEILVALAIGSVLMASVLAIFKSQADSHSYQKEVVALEQNLRGAMEVLTGELQMTGFAIGSLTPCIEVGNLDLRGDGSLMVLSNDDPNRNNADALRLTRAVDNGMPVIKQPGASPLIWVCQSNYEIGDKFFSISSDRSQGTYLIIEAINIENMTCGSCPVKCDKLWVDKDLANDYDDGTIYTPHVYSFYIEPDFNGDGEVNDPALMMVVDNGADPPPFVASPVAFGISDMQVTYILDDETETTAPLDTMKVRMVRIEISGTTPHPHKIGFGGTATQRQRALTTSVKLRNLGL